MDNETIRVVCQTLAIIVTNAIGYAALSHKLDRKVDRVEHDKTIARVRLEIATKADRTA